MNIDNTLTFILGSNTVDRIQLNSTQSYLPKNYVQSYIITYDGSTNASGVKMYIDGESIPLTVFTNNLLSPINNNNYLSIGSRVGGSPIQGQVADARIYNKELSSDEVLNISTKRLSGVDPGTDNLVGHWPLAEGIGTTCYDVSGNGNHGTATNITESTFWGTKQDVYHYNIKEGMSKYMYFDGVDDAITITNTAALRPGTGN